MTAPTQQKLIEEQACVEEARALLAEAGIALAALAMGEARKDPESLLQTFRRRADTYHARAMRRLQEVFYPADDGAESA